MGSKQGGSKADNYQTRLDFFQHLGSLPCQLLQLQLSSSNKMTCQLLSGPIRRLGCSWLIYFALSLYYYIPDLDVVKALKAVFNGSLGHC